MLRYISTVAALLMVITPCVSRAELPWKAKDLNPVSFKQAASHPPIVLVESGKPKATISVMSASAAGPAAQLQAFIEKATGAKLKIVKGQVTAPAIVVGDCPLARQHGIDPAKLPIEGFTIKTAPGYVFIVGRDESILGRQVQSTGTLWGTTEFLERFVGVRWYWPTELGQSVSKSDSLKVDPVWLEDAPVFRMRVMWPPMSNPWNGTGTPLTPVQNFLRAGSSWPNQLRVHQPLWGRVKEYTENRPEVFQLRSDGTRDHFMLCYGNPKTLETYLENIDRYFKKQPAHIGIAGNAITVSPNDAEIACYCKDCRKLWNKEGGQWGSGSKVVAKFVADLGREVKKRWPGKTVIYLPYLNYTVAPDGIKFPDNVEVQIAGMPGIAQYKEPAIAKFDQDNIDKWVKLSGRKIQNWHYSVWPADRTTATYLFPHTVRKFYQDNRNKTVGTFINGVTDHWPRQHLSLYCWLKVLWNPEFDVDAAIDEYCRRMYGPAANTVHELVTLQIDGWEKSRWPGERMSPKGVHEYSFPRKRVQQMEQLLAKARTEVAGDVPAAKRLAYYAKPFADFFEESRNYHEGTGLQPLLVQKVGENPKIDGKLDDAVWQKVQPNAFVRGWDKKQKKPTYPTTVRAVWTFDGVTFGFRMTEPTPDILERNIKGHDDSMAWWDDNIELLFDVTGRKEGEYYHFIINPNAAIADAHGKDFSWNAQGVKTKAHVGKNFWSLEVFFPYSAFPDAMVPKSGRNPTWIGNFTRHRVADRGLKQNKLRGQQQIKPRKDSVREYQRMNTTYAKPSNNLQDFAPFEFRE